MDTENMIRDMNRHVPVSRKTLLEYIESGECTYDTKGGVKCSVGRDEIELLAGMCTEMEKMRLRIPIIIGTDISCEAGAWKVEGTTEVAVVSRLLNKNPHGNGFLRLYHPDLRALRAMLPSLIAVVFTP